MSNLLVNIVSSVFVFALIIYTQSFYNAPLFDYSTYTEIQIIQQKLSPACITAWQLWSGIGLTIASTIPIIVPLVWNLSNRPRAVYYAVFIAGLDFWMNTLKTTYHQARPFWDNVQITPYGCSTQFGNPSGHSMMSMGSALAVYLDYLYCCETKKINEDSIFQSAWVKRTLLVLALTFAWTVAYSRIVLGMHSYNQIFFGMALGAWFAFSFHYIMYEKLMEHARELCLNEIFNMPGERSSSFRKLTLLCFGIFAALMGVQIANILIVKPHVTISS